MLFWFIEDHPMTVPFILLSLCIMAIVLTAPEKTS